MPKIASFYAKVRTFIMHLAAAAKQDVSSRAARFFFNLEEVMPGMMPPPEKTPIEKAIQHLPTPVSSEEVSLNFHQSLAPLVLGRSCVYPIHNFLVSKVSTALVKGELAIAKAEAEVGSLFMRSLEKVALGSNLPATLPGLAGFPGESIKEYCGRYFANEKKGKPFWLLNYDYQPNHLGLMLALCLSFPANHRFYLSSLPYLFPRFDEENLAYLLLEDNFKKVKVDSPKKAVTEALKSGVFPKVKAFVPGPVWEDLVGEHLSSLNLDDFRQDWSLADSVNKVNRCWGELDWANWDKFDVEWECSKHEGWRIATPAPNGKITGVSVFDGKSLWALSTESCDFPVKGDGDRFGDNDKEVGKLFTDKFWHIALAKNFIDWKFSVSLNSSSSPSNEKKEDEDF